MSTANKKKLQENVNAALSFHKEKRDQEALALLQPLIEQGPAYIKSLNNDLAKLVFAVVYNVADTLFRKKQYEAALNKLEWLTNLKQDSVELYSKIGCIYQTLRDYEAALPFHLKALVYEPSRGKLWTDIGRCFFRLGQFEESYDSYKKAEELDPDDAYLNLNWGLLQMLHGFYDEGLLRYENRFKVNDNFKNSKIFFEKLWRDESLEGKRVVVLTEQGKGDYIQAARYFPMLKQHGLKHLKICVKPELKRIVETSFKYNELEVIGESYTSDVYKDYDYILPVMSLLRYFKTTLESIPAETPYLKVDKKCAQSWKGRIQRRDCFKVGICWIGKASHQDDVDRTIRGELLMPLLSNESCDFYNLNVDKAIADSILCKENFIDHTADIQDFMDTAALMQEMDLIISVDTAVAHLAGALGLDVWILLRKLPPEWRWLLHLDYSPWYPTARLFKQENAGDWDEVLERVSHRLNSRIKLREKSAA